MTAAAFIPNTADSTQLEHLAEKLGQSAGTLTLQLESGEQVALPPVVAELLRHSVGELQGGQAVTVLPTEQELSTFEAAKLLGVSRPFLISNLLEAGKIPFHRVGNHRRIALSDLLAYQTELERRYAILDEITAADQEMGLY